MKTRLKLLETPFLHTFLFAIYLVLSLWAANYDQVQFFTITRPLIYAVATAGIATLAGLLLFRRRYPAAVFASLAVMLFLSYGRIFDLVDMKSIGGFLYGRHRYLVPLWLAIFALGTLAILRSRKRLRPLTRLLNTVSLFLIALVVFQAVALNLHTRSDVSAPASAVSEQGKPQQRQQGALPNGQARDVYYIILDAYGREDTLAARSDLDVSDFTRQLEALGFVVMNCAQSNYVWTPFSLSSTLNMEYLDSLNVNLNPAAQRIDFWSFAGLLRNNLVRQKFEQMDYQIVTFRTVYSWLDIPDSDYYVDMEKTTAFYDRQESINFQYLFLRTTAMRLLLESQEYSPDRFNQLPPSILRFVNPKAGLLSSRHFKQYAQNLHELEELSKLPAMPGPKFVYAHLMVTHQPYTFNLDGSMRWPAVQNEEGYKTQVLYSNSRMIDILKGIIAKSDPPPVIVLQGDHGYVYDQDRVKILNAYYLPESGAQQLYPEITPVNTFRLIFNQYFNDSLPLLPDISYHSDRSLPYKFETIPNNCPTSSN